MILNTGKLITEENLVKLAIPSGWKINLNIMLNLNFDNFSLAELREVLDIYYNCEVFSAEFSNSNRVTTKHSFYVYVHCHLNDTEDFEKGFYYEISYSLYLNDRTIPIFYEEIPQQNLEKAIFNLNKILIEVYQNIDLIVKERKLNM